MTALLDDPAEIARRGALVEAAPHLRALRPILADLRARCGEVPDPDPLDGGAEARLLVLLETPGARCRTTGLVSRDDPGGTGRNLRALFTRHGIERAETLIWNAVPWIIHRPGAANRAPTRREVAAGIAELPSLFAVLRRLEVVLLAGRPAGEAASTVAAARPGLAVLRMPHPSPTIQCTSAAIRARSEAAMAEAAAILLARRARAA